MRPLKWIDTPYLIILRCPTSDDVNACAEIIFLCVLAPLKLEHKPKRYQIDEKSLNITWDEPKINNGINETVVYDIQCFVCDGESHCNRTRCKDLKYDPAGPYNITKTYVRVSGVDVGSTYVFRIYPKYSLTERLAYNSTES